MYLLGMDRDAKEAGSTCSPCNSPFSFTERNCMEPGTVWNLELYRTSTNDYFIPDCNITRYALVLVACNNEVPFHSFL